YSGRHVRQTRGRRNLAKYIDSVRCAYRRRSASTIGPGEVTRLRRRSRKVCPARLKRARLFGHGVRAEDKQFVFDDWSAKAAAKVVQVVFGLRRPGGIIHPGIRVQGGVSMVFEKAAVKDVASAPSHEIHLEVRLSKPCVCIELVRLDGHL